MSGFLPTESRLWLLVTFAILSPLLLCYLLPTILKVGNLLAHFTIGLNLETPFDSVELVNNVIVFGN